MVLAVSFIGFSFVAGWNNRHRNAKDKKQKARVAEAARA
jgi:hypothetical protein